VEKGRIRSPYYPPPNEQEQNQLNNTVQSQSISEAEGVHARIKSVA
jgi:hypothetical protein